MPAYVRRLREVGPADVGEVGGKGANLGELSRLQGFSVPDGFCVSTAAFQRAMTSRGRATGLPVSVEEIVIPDEVREAILCALAERDPQVAYAVRSSATAEDLPGSSFAGLYDSYLNVVGAQAVLEHVRRCWASLFTERAVAYRAGLGLDAQEVQMAVVVQELLTPQAAGVLFTADPVSGVRTISTIEAVAGLGDGLVSGRVNPAGYKVRDGRILERTQGAGPLLTDAQLLRLERLGRQIEAHFGAPQDIEWCLVDDQLHVVQSRPITTLYPVPQQPGPPQPGLRVYVSVGHQQMMTDPMRPLGLSVFQHTAARPMFAAGGRLFIDVTRELSSPLSRAMVLDALGRSDPLIGDALETILERGELAAAAPVTAPPGGPPSGGPPPGGPPPLEDDPAIVAALIAQSRAAVESLEQDIQGRSGTDLLDAILEDIGRLKQSVTEPRSFAAIMAGVGAANWLNDHMLAWLGEKNAADTLSQSAPNNITAEMGLALLDVADTIRPCPEVIAWLQQAKDDGFLQGLLPLRGGQEAHDVLHAFLQTYGVRCVGEIDVTRPRWREAPTTLVPLILSNIRNFQPGAASRRLEQGRQAATQKAQALLERLEQLPDGAQKASETRRMIARLRTFIGYREYPKYGIVRRYFVCRQAMLQEAERLLQAGVLRRLDDVDFLTLPELREVVRTQTLDERLVETRRAAHARHGKLRPPRVLTSEGEMLAGAYRRAQLPHGALVGLPVSAGVVEGRARVLSSMQDATLEAGDILVTTFTDPSWTPLFVSIQGLVTEVGGLMTHGSVIAREYGLPAVVGVVDATRLIKDGQRVRVHGTEGYVEILA